jgi:uncharacterized protein (DUF362 family)/NAD-dependent dihydropyrimidine dehydrogenase PreA subunit
MTYVSLVKDADHAKAVRDAIELAGGINAKGTVLIKPNLSCAKPSGSGLVTNVEIVKEIVGIVADGGATPLVGDLPILGWEPHKVFDESGILAIKDAGGEFIDWSDDHVEITLKDAKVLKKVRISRAAIKADSIINVPVLKHHFFTHISGSMKNLFGLVEPQTRPRIHVLGLDEPLVDLYEFLKPKISMNVMDATYIAQSVRPSGPYYGPTEAASVSKVDMVLASKDAVALDSVAARVAMINPLDIEMVRIASDRGLGEINANTIGNARKASLKIKKSMIGKLLPFMEGAWTSEKLNRVAHPFAKRLYGDKVVSLKDARKEMNDAGPSNIIVAGECKACKLCVNACPAKNIELIESKPVIGQRCIKCFICVEICPGGVLAIERK